MVPQSHLPRSQRPLVLLTRPLLQSLRFARDLRKASGRALSISISPLMVPVLLPVLLPVQVPQMAWRAVIFSSETAVAGVGTARPATRAFCVGTRTAAAARKAGFDVATVAEDAAALVRQIVAQHPTGPLLHLRGEDSRGDIAQNLSMAGIVTDDIVVYRQNPQPLSIRAQRLLAGKRPVLVPLFSPRSAELFCASAEPKAPLHIVALSQAVSEAISPSLQAISVTAPAPNGEMMLQMVTDLLNAPPFT